MNINYPLLIDGGLSNELEKQGCNLNHKLWSAKLIATNPKAIVQAHLNYLIAGARCITTASYQASIPGFKSLGYDQVTAEKLILQSVQLAEEAVAQFMEIEPDKFKPYIAASIGPYGAYLADGSEYHGNYGISDSELRDFHLPRIKLLDHSNADFLACETIPSFQEAKVLARLLEKCQKPAWISFSCKDEQHLNDGTPISQCAAFLSYHPNIFAIGINCTAPKYIAGLIKAIQKEAGEKRIIVYPNSGEVYDAESKIWGGSSDPGMFLARVEEWVNLGVDIIGGCCRVGTRHIAQLSKIY